MKKILILMVANILFITLNGYCFEENFSNLNNWMLFGSPSSQIVDVHGRTGVFDNNGDGWCDSGAISKSSYNFKGKKVIIEAEFYLQVDDLAGCWVGPSIGISNGKVVDRGACTNDGYYWRGISVFMSGDACWATPSQYRRHSYLTGSFGIGKNYSLNIDDYVNKWTKLKMVIDEKGYISAYLNDKFMGKSEKPIENDYLENAHIYIGGRSSGYGGKAYIDNLKVYEETCISESQLQQKYNEGFEAGKEYCKNHPEECGLKCDKNQDSTTNPFIPPTSSDCNATFDFTTGVFHVPCFQTGDRNIWLDFQLIKYQPTVLMELKNFGTNE